MFAAGLDRKMFVVNHTYVGTKCCYEFYKNRKIVFISISSKVLICNKTKALCKCIFLEMPFRQRKQLCSKNDTCGFDSLCN